VRRLLALWALASAGCASETQAKPKVAVSIFPIFDITRRIAGDRLDVRLVMARSGDDHAYEPKPQEVASLRDARLVVMVGSGLDDWAVRAVTSASRQAPERLELSRLVGLSPTQGAAGPIDGSEVHAPVPPADPHFWLDPVRMRKAATLIAEALGALDPAGRSAFQTRRNALEGSLAALDMEIATRTRAFSHRTIVTFHASLGYFAERYNLEVAAVIEPVPGREPTARELQSLIARVRATGTPALFGEPQFDRRPAEMIAKECGLPLLELDMLGGGPGRESYEDLMRSNLRTLEQALK
jgi:zinc transport system substrate-binding protein